MELSAEAMQELEEAIADDRAAETADPREYLCARCGYIPHACACLGGDPDLLHPLWM